MKLLKESPYPGASRIVLLFKDRVIKIPNRRWSWQDFLLGIISNIRENETWKSNSGKYEKGNSYLLCPVLWCSWGGWILIMERAIPCDNDEILDFKPWIDAGFGGDDAIRNYGRINGIVVKLDYGVE